MTGLGDPIRSFYQRLALLGALLSIALVLGTSLATAAPAVVATDPAAPSIFVYNGNGALNEGYVNFAASTGKALMQDVVLPDLAVHTCVVLPINAVPFDAVQIAALAAYVNGGGRLFVVGERSAFPEAVASLNGVLDALASDIDINLDQLGAGFNTTENIPDSPFTLDVDAIHYGGVGGPGTLTVGGDAQVLVNTANEGLPIVASEPIGAGFVIASSDSNLWSDNSDGGYLNQDNGILVGNICGVTSEITAHSVVAEIGSPSPPSTIAERVDVYAPFLQATLALGAGGAALVGEEVHFLANGEHVCTAVTDEAGLAACEDPVATALAIAAGEFTAFFEGTAHIDPSEDAAGLLVIADNEVP